MPEPTLEALAARVAVLEQTIARLTNPSIIPVTRDWRTVVGISRESEFTHRFLAEIEANSDAERKAAQEGTEE